MRHQYTVPKSDHRRLIFKRYQNGKLRPCWFGDATVRGKRKIYTLNPFQGTPPKSESVSDTGDKAFELSRAKALAMLDDLLGGPQSEADQGALYERALSYKYGITIRSVPLSKLVEEWDHLPRRRKPSSFHRSNCHRILKRFVSFMADKWPDVTELGGVKAEHARKFLDEEENRKISARTWNVTLTVLRSAFAKLDENADAYRRYLSKLPTRDVETIHRKPYSPEEMKTILDVAKDSDTLMFRMIVTAYCSGLRRGDLCRLKWRDVDLKAGFVSVKTNKTGERIEFPILPLLRGVLEDARKDAIDKADIYVFPDAAKAYAKNPQSLDIRLKKVLSLAGFREDAVNDDDAPPLPVLPVSELRDKGLRVIAGYQMEKARVKAKEIFERYLRGETVPDIALAMKVSKGIVSTRLNQIQNEVGAAILRKDQASAGVFRGVTVAPIDEDGSPRLKRASLRGWHSFRTSFITQALSAGLPMELVRRVTGHSTVDVVLKHYFKPGRADFSKAINAAMPQFLLKPEESKPDSRIAEILKLVDATTAKNAKKNLKMIRQLVLQLDSLPGQVALP